MDISKLASNRLRVLTEADYSLNNTTGNSPQTPSQQVTEDQLEQNQTGDNKNIELPDNVVDEINNADPNDDVGEDTTQQQNQSDDDSAQNDFSNYGFTDELPDDYTTDDGPKLKLLNSLSDTEYKLNNIKCIRQFRELKKNVEDTINNNIMNITTKNPRHRQLVNIVHNNLSSMLEDLDNYILFKFGDIYEDNVIAYITYLKRYKIAMKIIREIIDINIKESQKDD